MTEHTSDPTRRDLLGGILGGAALVALSPGALGAAPKRARVIRVESEAVWNGERRDAKVVARMVDTGLAALLGAASAEAAWKLVFKPGMRVGLKINLLGRPLVFTSREMTEAVAAGAITAGVKPADILVWDRFADHFPPTDYAPGPGKLGETIVVGGEYDMAKGAKTSGGLCGVDTIPTHKTDVTVSLPVLKDHGGAGVTLALKNIAFGAFQHHGSAHEGYCDPYIAEVCAHFPKVATVPLIVLDATKACFDGGPRPSSRSTIWHENAIYLATDPVALDVVGRKVIMAKRVSRGMSDKTRQCRHIETAASKGLGILDESLIDLVTIKV
jgi:hypothetical protein